MLLWTQGCSICQTLLICTSALRLLAANVTSEDFDLESALVPPLKNIPPCSTDPSLRFESNSRTKVPDITNNSASTANIVRSSRPDLWSWAPAPCFLTTSNPGMFLVLNSITPGGTQRQLRWMKWAFRYVIEQVNQRATARTPQLFQSDTAEIAFVQISEREHRLGYDQYRPAIASGIRNLLSVMNQNGAAQVKGFYLSGKTVIAILNAQFGIAPPPIPGPWPQPLPQTLDFFVPGIDSQKIGRFEVKGEAGDGWDTVHCSRALLKLVQSLEEQRRQGVTLPQATGLNTEGGEDIQIGYEPDPTYRGPSTMYMQIKFFQALQNVVSQRGMLDVGMAFVDTSRKANIGLGLIDFLDYQNLDANPSHANTTISAS